MIMKKMKICAVLILLCSMMAVSCRNAGKSSTASGDTEYSMRVVVKDGEVAGVLVEEKADSYIVEVQDNVEIDKAGAHVELWKASDGKGFVWLKDFGEQNVYARPDTGSEVVGTITYEKGCVPEAYPCLGFENGWFALRTSSRQGYVQSSLVDWSAICTF